MKGVEVKHEIYQRQTTKTVSITNLNIACEIKHNNIHESHSKMLDAPVDPIVLFSVRDG